MNNNKDKGKGVAGETPSTEMKHSQGSYGQGNHSEPLQNKPTEDKGIEDLIKVIEKEVGPSDNNVYFWSTRKLAKAIEAHYNKKQHECLERIKYICSDRCKTGDECSNDELHSKLIDYRNNEVSFEDVYFLINERIDAEKWEIKL